MSPRLRWAALCIAVPLGVFGLAVFRETQVEGRPFRTAAGTGMMAVAYVMAVLGVCILFVWLTERRRNTSKGEVDAPDEDANRGVNP